MRCPKCRKELREGAKFCPSCGTRVSNHKRNRRFRVFIIIILILSAILGGVGVGILAARMIGRSDYHLKKSGSFYENMSDFAVASSQEPDELTKSFLEGIKYEIKNIDQENMTATVDISIPVISDELSTVLDKVIEENSGKEYDEIKEIAESELSDVFKSNQIESRETTMIFQIEKIDGSYKLVPPEEWNQVLTENLESLYMDYFKLLIGGMTDEVPQ